MTKFNGAHYNVDSQWVFDIIFLDLHLSVPLVKYHVKETNARRVYMGGYARHMHARKTHNLVKK